MQIDGYRLVCKAHAAPADYYPSLIGIAQDQTGAALTDTYFERLDTTEGEVSAITLTRWVTFDNLPSDRRDPILAIKTTDGFGCYITLTEITEQATEQGDKEVLAMLRSLKLGAYNR